MRCTDVLLLPALLTLNVDAGAEPAESAAIVERVEVKGNRYIPSETILHYVSTKPGDRLDEEKLLADFRRLWETGFLDDIVLHVDDGARGRIVTFQVDERRRIQVVDYRGNKALSTSSLEDELKKLSLIHI